VVYLHDLGVIHRDLKPENILLDEDSPNAVIKLGDFGSAINKNPENVAKEALGSLHYIAPEVLTNHYDEKCDLWSCGVILYAMLSGYSPFSGKDDKTVLGKIRLIEYSFDHDIWSSISSEAKDLITKLLCSS